MREKSQDELNESMNTGMKRGLVISYVSKLVIICYWCESSVIQDRFALICHLSYFEYSIIIISEINIFVNCDMQGRDLKVPVHRG